MLRFILSLALLLTATNVGRAVKYGDYDIVLETQLVAPGGGDVTDHAGGLTWDGTDLWSTTFDSAAGTGKLCRIHPETHAVTATYPLPFEAHGIVWDGTHLRIVDSKTEPRVWAYDREGNAVSSRLVEADTPNFQGLAWDGNRLWHADDWLLYQLDENAEAAKIYSNSWIGIKSGLTWDGTHLMAIVNQPGWPGGIGAYTMRIDPVTGDFSDYRRVGSNVVSANHHQIAIGNGRMWILKAGGLAHRLYEVVLPTRVALPALESAWGVFQALDGFAVPQRSTALTGSSLGAVGSDFWYGDFFNISKIGWSDRTTNTAALDLDWTIAGGCSQDITSDGTRVWITDIGTNPTGYRVYELTLTGQLVRNFVLAAPLDAPDGIAWDGEALWVLTHHSEQSGMINLLARYTPEGQLLAGPFTIGTSEGGFFVVDLAWHNGELWLLDDNDGTDAHGPTGSITRVSPTTGAILARYPTGIQSTYSGLASDGANLFAIARPKRVGASPPPTVDPLILRLGLPADMNPPRLAGATATTSQVTLHLSEMMSLSQFSNKANYRVECPPGTPIDLSPAGVTLTPDFSARNKVTISGLALPAGSDFVASVRLVRDATGNLVRDDGVSNVLTGTVGALTAPAAVTANELLFNEVTVGWRDASAGETSFRLERKVGVDGEWTLVTEIASTTGAGFGAVIAHTDTMVSAGQVYSYRVRAQSAGGNSPFSDVAVASLMDADGDGWSDSYETSVTQTNPTRADTDADGARDPAENVAGTDPLDPGSVFKVKAIEMESDGRVTIRWNGVAGKTYRVVRSATPGFASTELVVSNIPGVAPVTVHTTSTAQPAGKAFYRVEVE
jgi:hypothetical protein